MLIISCFNRPLTNDEFIIFIVGIIVGIILIISILAVSAKIWNFNKKKNGK